MKLLHSIQVFDQLIAADGVETFDLAVNPLSVILLTLRPLNDTGTLLNFESALGIYGAVNRMSVIYRGSGVVGMTGRDLAALNYFRHGIMPWQASHVNTNNDRRAVVLPILMGRWPYDPVSCFPATRRGELVLELDLDIADSGYDGLRLSVETIELLDATPEEFERKVQITQTFAATGENDVDLPTGNLVRGILAFGTTGFAGAAPAPTLGRLSTYLDNEQWGYSSTDFEVAHMLPSLMGRNPPAMDGRVHTLLEVAGGGVVTATQAEGASSIGSGGWGNYCYLDFDPTRDDTFSMDTSGASRLYVRSDAEAANLVRMIAVERIPI